MALPTITITNVSGGPLSFPQLNVATLADTSSATISGWNFTTEILNDTALSAALAAGDITATVSGESITNADTTLTAAQANVMLQPINGLDILHNMAGTVDPTVTDDEDAGYSINSFWVDTVGLGLWVCFDATAGAAIWSMLSGIAVTTFTYGAKFNATGRYAAVNGPPGSASKSSLDEGSEVTSPANVNTIGFVWNSADATATTVFTLLVNGLFGATIPLTGASGTVMALAASISTGDMLAIEFTSGPNPNDTNCQLILGG